jgi:hypothetical protein
MKTRMNIINHGTKWKNGKIGKFEESNLELKWIEFTFTDGILMYRYPLAERYQKALVVAKGFIVYLLKVIEADPNVKSADLYDSYYNFRFKQFQVTEECKPDAFSRDLASEFHNKHIEEEQKHATYSKGFFDYLEDDNRTFIKGYCDNYFEYIKRYGVNTQEVPQCLQTEEAKKILLEAVENGLILLSNNQYRWNYNKYKGQLLAYFCEKSSFYLGLSKTVDKEGKQTVSWKPFETLFNTKNIKSYKNDHLKDNYMFRPKDYEQVDKLFNNKHNTKD